MASLNDALLRASKDRHLRVRRRPSPKSDGGYAGWQHRMRCEAIDNAGGIQSVTRLDDRVTIITIAPYLSSIELARPYIDAALQLVAGTSHLVLDVRDGRGGTPETVALICGYLLGDRAVHLQDVIERDGSLRQFWTVPETHRLPEMVPVSVLTSSLTFSGCEELAYDLQALGRATIVGERTMGGAHPVHPFPLTDILEVSIPVAKSRSAITGTNWEGTGITPDVGCAAGDALTVALERVGTDARAGLSWG